MLQWGGKCPSPVLGFWARCHQLWRGWRCLPSPPASAAKHLRHFCQEQLLHFSSPLLLSVTCLSIYWLNRQITLFSCALKATVLCTKSGSHDTAALTYPANGQGGILCHWWARDHRPAPAGASRRHAAAGTGVLSGSRAGEGNELLSLCSMPLIPPEQRASKLCLMKTSQQLSAPQICSGALSAASELKCWVEMVAPEVPAQVWGREHC